MAGAKKQVPIDSHPPSPKVETTEPAGDPLLEDGEEVGGTIVLPGNVTLASLSLSNNHITDHGLAAFLEAIEIQKQYTQRGQGLLRLSFKVVLSIIWCYQWLVVIIAQFLPQYQCGS